MLFNFGIYTLKPLKKNPRKVMNATTSSKKKKKKQIKQSVKYFKRKLR